MHSSEIVLFPTDNRCEKYRRFIGEQNCHRSTNHSSRLHARKSSCLYPKVNHFSFDHFSHCFLFRDLLNTSIIHRVMYEYLRNANDKGREEIIDAVKEKLIKMIHSRDGARVAIYCLWYGTNKDRKLLIKSFKSFVVKIAKEEQGYPVLWTIFDVVDDTKLVSKAILQV